MSRIKKIITRKPPKKPAIRIELENGVYWQIDNHEVDQMNLASNAALYLGPLDTDLHFHQNQDNSWTIATGQKPDVWPEDYEAEEI